MSTPIEEFVNTLELESAARQKLSPDLYALIAGGDRRAFERITFRPRMMVSTRQLDLSLDLFGQRHFAPILIGPIAQQQRFHPAGELATARGANAAKAGFIVTSRSSSPLDQVAPLTGAPLWLQLDATADPDRAKQALQLGVKAICLNAPYTWAAVDRLRKAIAAPILLKGIMTPEDAKAALQHGVNGIIVSSYREASPPMANSLDLLPAVAAEVGGKVPILIDGSFRRGSDILKALALGARAVLVARPVLWGLASYGDRGVQQAIEMLQTELARDMAMCGLPSLQQITPACIKVHRR